VWNREVVIRERIRFTLQWGRRLGRFSLRAGIKESMIGLGADAAFGRGRLRFSVDAMESSFDRAPRIKLAAALALFRGLYIVGGVDDSLRRGEYLPIAPWPPGQDVPIQYEEFRYGRDFFLGLDLRFTDQDANRLLFLYGAALGALLSG
jgi:hypothetical protein